MTVSLGVSLAEGNWCPRCEVFEQEMDVNDGRCMGCGCPETDHAVVEIICMSGETIGGGLV